MVFVRTWLSWTTRPHVDLEPRTRGLHFASMSKPTEDPRAVPSGFGARGPRGSASNDPKSLPNAWKRLENGLDGASDPPARPDVGSWTPALRGGQTATHYVRPGVLTTSSDSKMLLLLPIAMAMLLRCLLAAVGGAHSHHGCHCGFHSVLEFVSEPGKPDALRLGGAIEPHFWADSLRKLAWAS